MSRMSGNAPQRKPTPNVYTVLAFAALVALGVAIGFTVQANLELNKTGNAVDQPMLSPDQQENPFTLIKEPSS